MIEPILRNQKKTDLITAKIGSCCYIGSCGFCYRPAGRPGGQPPVFFSLCTQYWSGTQGCWLFLRQTVDRKSRFRHRLGEMMAYFVLKVENISAKANYNVDVEQARQSMLQSQESVIQRAGTDALKKKAKIEDDRSKFL